MPDTDTQPTADQPDAPAAPQATDQPDAPADLGDAGRRALAEERAARKAAEKEARRAKDLEAKLAEFEEASKSEQEKAIEKASKEAAAAARAEVTAETNKRLLDAEMRVAASGVLADPTDALRYIDDLDGLLDDDGNPDSTAIAEKVKALATERPYLAVGATPPNHGSADGGARSGASQISRDALKGMTPQQIVEARNAGRLDALMRSGS